MPMLSTQLKSFLDAQVLRYNRVDFIAADPIAIPHAYRKRQDIEIAGFLAATLAWGQRQVAMRKCRELLGFMDQAPYDFVMHHQPHDLKALHRFRHRTFQPTDALYFMRFLQHYYRQYDTLETAFTMGLPAADGDVEAGLVHFHELFFSLPDHPMRTRKHVPTPRRKAPCKRLNMFLRWMVRQDTQGVDLGLWKNIQPRQLVCPCDVHVARVSRQLRLLQRTRTDWPAAQELTRALRQLSPEDPVQYDFALFGLGIQGAQGLEAYL
ncbi:MAG: TIGR02757 family protein [Bacteroidota bacterium]